VLHAQIKQFLLRAVPSPTQCCRLGFSYDPFKVPQSGGVRGLQKIRDRLLRCVYTVAHPMGGKLRLRLGQRCGK
jgi:hypothetical protein